MGGNESKMGMNSAGRTLNAFYIALLSVYFTRQEQVDEEISLSPSIVRSFLLKRSMRLSKGRFTD